MSVHSFICPSVIKTPQTAKNQSFHLTTILTTMLNTIFTTLTFILTTITTIILLSSSYHPSTIHHFHPHHHNHNHPSIIPTPSFNHLPTMPHLPPHHHYHHHPSIIPTIFRHLSWSQSYVITYIFSFFQNLLLWAWLWCDLNCSIVLFIVWCQNHSKYLSLSLTLMLSELVL